MNPPGVWRWDILNQLLELTERQRYLEIGVQSGRCGARVNARDKWGVDPEPRAHVGRSYSSFFRLTSDEFFRRLGSQQRFDVVFIDGLHHADQVLRDVNNALAHLDDGGFVVLHDCNPQSEIAQRVPRASGVWNGDVWKAMVALRRRQDLDAFTVDTDEGIGIVRRATNPDPVPAVPAELTYAALEADRSRLLGLVPADRWLERMDPRLNLGRVAVVSAIFGHRDSPLALPNLDTDSAILFTDSYGAGGWETVRVDPPADPRLEARRIKTLALDLPELAGADVVVWIDGRILPTGRPLRPLLRLALRSGDLAAYRHPWRACAYDEALECARLDRAPAGALHEQTAAYESEGFPRDAGLWNTMVVARRRTDPMVELGRAWWAEIQRHTQRDQVSLPYLLWRRGVECVSLGDDVYRNGSSPHFVRGQHR